jgi:hypothetical protein
MWGQAIEILNGYNLLQWERVFVPGKGFHNRTTLSTGMQFETYNNVELPDIFGALFWQILDTPMQ